MRYPPLAEEVAGVLAATAPLGMPSGKVGHHPGWKPLQGSASDHVPGLLQARAGSPDPFRGIRASLRRVLTAATATSTVGHVPRALWLFAQKQESGTLSVLKQECK